jgi:hypothetical protein
MFGTDFLKDSSVALNASKGISAKNFYAVYSGYLVPELFDAKRSVHGPLHQQSRCAFSTSSNTVKLAVHCFARFPDEFGGYFQQATPVRKTVDHECGKHIDNVDRDIDALFNSGRDVYAPRLYCPTKTIEV